LAKILLRRKQSKGSLFSCFT